MLKNNKGILRKGKTGSNHADNMPDIRLVSSQNTRSILVKFKMHIHWDMLEIYVRQFYTETKFFISD